MERWAVKDGMDDPGGREQFPSRLEVYTMYPPDTPGQPYVRAPLNPELAELSTVLKLMGLSRGMRAGCHFWADILNTTNSKINNLKNEGNGTLFIFLTEGIFLVGLSQTLSSSFK